jgi:putative component of toxin-antitoxin plasmid stabilization module
MLKVYAKSGADITVNGGISVINLSEGNTYGVYAESGANVIVILLDSHKFL